MSEAVTYSQDGDVAILALDDGKANAMSSAMSGAVGAALDRAEVEAKAVVIVGRPGLFCGGFDLKVINGGDGDARLKMVQDGETLLLRCYLYPLPLVMAVSGHAVAAGALLALTGDYRYGAAGGAKIGLNETAIGLTLPSFGIELARDRLEETRLSEAILAAQLYSPDAAAAIGYIDETVAADGLMDAALSKARALAEISGPAYAGNKKILRQPTVDRIRAWKGE